jgi:methylenetetrahydrofolate dehydrogenase (NADP+)/methenyltetrahydrofolate cyclohydrolase
VGFYSTPVGFSNVQGIPGIRAVFREPMPLDGRVAGAAIRSRVAAQVDELVASGEAAPGLATILVGEDPASETYVAAKHRACAEVGISSFRHSFGGQAPVEEVEACIAKLNSDSAVSGILLQLPLPDHLDSRPLLELIDERKDVDGLTAASMGRLALGAPGHVPCTPRGIIALLDHYEIELAGRRAVVVGRSQLVGRPVATLLTQRDCTVTVCHSRSRGLEEECRRAEILVAAAGRPHLIGASHVGRDAVVVDVGIHRRDGELIGDVDPHSVGGRARALSPVPGGVGPMTIACLLENTLEAARMQAQNQPLPATGEDLA